MHVEESRHLHIYVNRILLLSTEHQGAFETPKAGVTNISKVRCTQHQGVETVINHTNSSTVAISRFCSNCSGFYIRLATMVPLIAHRYIQQGFHF